MPSLSAGLGDQEKQYILTRYREQGSLAQFSYGTVRDYCDSADHLSSLSNIQRDLKDLQRPAALKNIVSILPPGATLLEIGAGEPHVASLLADLGYQVTVVDPYDGSGFGPTEFEEFSRQYPHVKIIRDHFSAQLSLLTKYSFDCIYSISVLEHIHQPYLRQVFDGIVQFLVPGGYSFHLIDHVLEGEFADFHAAQLSEVAAFQSELSSEEAPAAVQQLKSMLDRASADLDTYYLSAEGHNNWRGATPYDQFPFRKVISVHMCHQRT